MLIYILSPYAHRIISPIRDNMYITTDPIYHNPECDLVISYGYRHKVKPPLLNKRCINMHISYLPWNRGADPNIWSIVDDTPKGVTIHKMDEGWDTGEILLQQEVKFDDTDTLATSYEKLQQAMAKLFIDNWRYIRDDAIGSRAQEGEGSYHNSKDISKLIIPNGYNSTVKEVRELNAIIR